MIIFNLISLNVIMGEISLQANIIFNTIFSDSFYLRIKLNFISPKLINGHLTKYRNYVNIISRKYLKFSSFVLLTKITQGIYNNTWLYIKIL